MQIHWVLCSSYELEPESRRDVQRSVIHDTTFGLTGCSSVLDPVIGDLEIFGLDTCAEVSNLSVTMGNPAMWQPSTAGYLNMTEYE